MTTTLHERGAHDAMLRFLQQPHGGQSLSDVYEGIHSKRWPSWYIDTIGQEWRAFASGSWPMEQVFAFMFVDNLLQAGALAVVDIEVGSEPHSDCSRQKNQEALSSLGNFTAVVDQTQHCGDNDGGLSWDERVPVSWRVPPGEWNDAEEDAWIVGLIESGWAPLEIGSTKASTTAFHLAESRAVARWPYGHRSIRLFVDIGIFHPTTRDASGRARLFQPTSVFDAALDVRYRQLSETASRD